VLQHCVPHTAKPALHVMPHTPVLHTALPFVGAAHGMQDGPHESALSATHWPLHMLKLGSHWMPHCPDWQVAAPFGVPGHCVQAGPQAVGTSVMHCPPQ